MPEAMTACAMRKVRKTAAFGATSVPSVAIRNRISDPISTFLRPKRSEIGPMTICRTADSARYSATESCISA